MLKYHQGATRGPIRQSFDADVLRIEQYIRFTGSFQSIHYAAQLRQYSCHLSILPYILQPMGIQHPREFELFKVCFPPAAGTHSLPWRSRHVIQSMVESQSQARSAPMQPHIKPKSLAVGASFSFACSTSGQRSPLTCRSESIKREQLKASNVFVIFARTILVLVAGCGFNKAGHNQYVVSNNMINFCFGELVCV